MKRLLALTLTLMLLPLCVLAEPLPVYDPGFGWQPAASYTSDTLRYEILPFSLSGVDCYLTCIWMADPGQQIHKATAVWEESLAYPADMAATVEGAALAINGSGYVSPVFPWIPENYPGGSEDYHYTPLGSLTITNGEIFRNLAGVPYYGLTLQEDGLHLHVGEDNDSVLATHPTQTWSFYVECPLIQAGQDILDRSWPFANNRAIRTIIAQKDANNYVLLTVTSQGGGLPLTVCVDFLMNKIQPEWAYNLDGGPSCALLHRTRYERTLHAMYGSTRQDADVMVFTELLNQR
ncbi:MAG: phosphodiester glycosidase family protein [Aristaeellaceae bacterium]